MSVSNSKPVFVLLQILVSLFNPVHLLFANPKHISPPTNLGDFYYSAGMAKNDITGPPVGVMFFGYGREEQLGEGIHLRQYARSLVLKDNSADRLIVFVTAEVGAIPFEIQRDVVARLKRDLDPRFEYANVILNASHTHSTPTGYFHYSLFNESFLPKYFNLISDGIFLSIKTAYLNMKPAQLLYGKGNVIDGGINRSLVAYLKNPIEEREKYGSNIDTEMYQILVRTPDRDIGLINWFGVHPTNITFDNHLISSDNKGVAAYLSERYALKNGNSKFVAIFAQSNEGDVSPNLNLNNTGPGKDMFESSKLIGERQFNASQSILHSESLRVLPAGLKYRSSFVDFSKLVVRKDFSNTGQEETLCPSAYGYSFAAGSTEEGGGHWLFREGMVDADRRFYIDALAAYLIKSPSESLRKCHYPKAVLLAMGETLPYPSLPHVLPIGLIQLGDIGFLVSPNEVTTMASRRLKASVKSMFGIKLSDIILSGPSNEFAGYVTTKEEYQSQQYEGGHTLFGPNSLFAFQQEYVRISQDLLRNLLSTSDKLPRDLTSELKVREIPNSDESGSFLAMVIEPNAIEYEKGSIVSCIVSSANPNVGYPNIASYFQVELNTGGKWTDIFTDRDISTKFKFFRPKFPFYQGQAELQWETELSDVTGEYRLVHNSKYRDKLGQLHDYDVKCPSFKLR